MSRTYKLAIYGQKIDKKDKRWAGKAVRRCGNIPDGSSYKIVPMIPQMNFIGSHTNTLEKVIKLIYGLDFYK